VDQPICALEGTQMNIEVSRHDVAIAPNDIEEEVVSEDLSDNPNNDISKHF
jgi:hypothetical protein